MRRAVPFTAAGLAAAIAAALLVRQGGAEPTRAPTPRTDAGAAAFALREPRVARRLVPRPAAATVDLPLRDFDRTAPESSVARVISSHSADELALFARFERLTGRAAPPGVIELIQLRREGAAADELVALATRRFEGDPLGRATVLEWMRENGAR